MRPKSILWVAYLEAGDRPNNKAFCKQCINKIVEIFDLPSKKDGRSMFYLPESP
jgi:hypothetical protein